MAPLFDPEQGTTVVEPVGQGNGYWAGAPGAVYDTERGRFYLYYRLRVPRELGRGIECRIAESADGERFETIWSAKKQEFPTDSMERAALVERPGGGWLLYLSYVDPDTSKWRIDVAKAGHPSEFELGERRKVFTAEDCDVEGVKDPYVAVFGGLYYMLISYATRPAATVAEHEKHGTADIFNTGKTTSNTGLAVSGDGITWRWLGDCFSPRPGMGAWDAYAARIGTLVYVPPVWTAFYDGSASVEENYEERTGMAVSFDLRHFERITADGPILTSPHASGSLRYMDAIQLRDEVLYYYEYARPDGSHELRLNRVRVT
ncbi:MAG: hypothetical protein HY332_01660 [Chloroflexi bacterium]|nr:hypothetical protein [Chloroflexota bacterium]